MHNEAICALSIVEASIKFISYEPLLQHVVANGAYDLSECQWGIIGRQTPPSKKTEPKVEWINEIENACEKAGIPYFEKNNLQSLLNRPLRQEFPILESEY